jgi:hypothetical protein
LFDRLLGSKPHVAGSACGDTEGVEHEVLARPRLQELLGDVDEPVAMVGRSRCDRCDVEEGVVIAPGCVSDASAVT